jgi:tetratricopeptide (TPR) repeat protein
MREKQRTFFTFPIISKKESLMKLLFPTRTRRKHILATAVLWGSFAFAPIAIAADPAPQPAPTQHPGQHEQPTVFIQPSGEQRTRITPFMERYFLDELKDIRITTERTRAELNKTLAEKELELADKAMNYSNTTITFFFYVFTVLGGLLATLGWKSLRDIKSALTSTAEKELNRLSEKYEERLYNLEKELSEKGEIIIQNQQEIERTQTVHALWLQANQAPNPRAKIALYDQILEITPKDYEAMAYKADAALLVGDKEWALSLCNRILEENPEYAFALYQRACAYSGLEMVNEALEDLRQAVTMSPALLAEAEEEEEFEPIRDLPEFQDLLGKSQDEDAQAPV